MNNMLFYKKLIRRLINEHLSGKCNNLCIIRDRVTMYDNYEEKEDVFVKMEDCCVWLKKDYMDTTALNITNIMGRVNMIGYVLEEPSKSTPKIVKALAIYT